MIVHHGTPSSGLLYEPWIEDAAASGIRLIGFDRAGYGDSSRLQGRNIAAAARDVEAIADALELERFATWGISGGGPHALACAALCGDRLTAVGQPGRSGAVGRGRARLARRDGRGERRGVRRRARRRGCAPPLGRAGSIEMLATGPEALKNCLRLAARRRRPRRARRAGIAPWMVAADYARPARLGRRLDRRRPRVRGTVGIRAERRSRGRC